MKKQLILTTIAIVLTLGCGLGNNAKTLPTAVVRVLEPTAIPQPTFTPTPPIIAVATIVPPTNIPLPTDTPVPVEPTATPTDTPAPQPTQPSAPQATITGATVNVRSGPGTAYPRVGQVSSGYTGEIKGRNSDASWLYMSYPGGEGWVYSNLTQIQGDVNSVGVMQVAPPPATPTPPPPPTAAAPAPTPVPAGPSYPYKIHNIFTKPNGAITQIRGYIQDSSGTPVNGARVRVRIGSFCTVSVPSGTPGVYPPGNYDVLLDNHAKDGDWLVAIVDRPTDPKSTQCDPGAAQLSEEVTVHTSHTDGVVFVEFDKVQ